MKKLSIILIICLSSAIFTGCQNDKLVIAAGVLGGIGSFAGGIAAFMPEIKSFLHDNKLVQSSDDDSIKSNDKKNSKSDSKSDSADGSLNKTETKDKIETQSESKSTQSTDKVNDKQSSVQLKFSSEAEDKAAKVKYKNRKDEHGFSFDYTGPINRRIVGHNDESYKYEPDFWPHYEIRYSNNSKGTDYDIKKELEELRSHENDYIKDIKVTYLNDSSAILTWMNIQERKDYIEKIIMVKDHYGFQQRIHFIYSYGERTKDEEKAVAQHIMDSLKLDS